jgi:hypothetical protein
VATTWQALLDGKSGGGADHALRRVASAKVRFALRGEGIRPRALYMDRKEAKRSRLYTQLRRWPAAVQAMERRRA